MKYYFTICCTIDEVCDCVVDADNIAEAKQKIKDHKFIVIDEHENDCKYDFESVDFNEFMNLEEEENA